MSFHLWVLPILIIGATFVLAIPIGLYMAWVFEGRFRVPTWLALDRGAPGHRAAELEAVCPRVHAASTWSTFVVGFAVLSLQPYLPLNPDDKGMLAPTTIFHTTVSFMTNTNQQHYSGEVHLSYFSQLFFICWKQILSPVIGLAALLAIIRGLRGDQHMGNFYLDLWRGVVYCLRAPLPHRGCAPDRRRRADDSGGQCQGRDGRAWGDGERTTPAPSNRRRSPAVRWPPSSP